MRKDKINIGYSNTRKKVSVRIGSHVSFFTKEELVAFIAILEKLVVTVNDINEFENIMNETPPREKQE